MDKDIREDKKPFGSTYETQMGQGFVENGLKEELKKMREYRGLNKREMARATGIHHVCLSQYENGTRVPSAKTIKKMAEALNYSVIRDDTQQVHLIPNEYKMGAPSPQAFYSPLEFEIAWIKGGGGAHPLNNPYARAAVLAVRAEQLNEDGVRKLLDFADVLLKVPEYKAKK